MILLVIVDPIGIVGQHISIARGQSFVLGRLSERIDDVVQKAIVETALIEVGLYFGKFFPGSGKTCIFFRSRVEHCGCVQGLPAMSPCRSALLAAGYPRHCL